MELGNLMFNTNENHEYPCEDYIVDLLRGIERVLEIMMWNKGEKDYASPFGNTGNSFKNDTFEVQAYSWNDEEVQEYNFLYKVDRTKSNLQDIKISWYKYLGRDTTINQKLDPNIIVDMHKNCINSLYEEINKEGDNIW